MNRLRRHVLLPLLLAAAGQAQSAPTLINAGIGGFAGSVDCAYRLNGSCQWLGPYDSSGSASVGATSASFRHTGERGTAHSSGLASRDSYLPELHAYASSNGAYVPALPALDPSRYTGSGAGVADANVWGVQGYRYTGAEPFELRISALLDSVFSTSGLMGALGHSSFGLGLFYGADYVFSQDHEAARDVCLARSYGTSAAALARRAACEASTGATLFGSTTAMLFDTGEASASISHWLHSGDRFYVMAFLDASVCCGGTVDSSHTLRLAFNDSSALESIAVPGAVPEPSTPWLLAAALLPLWLRHSRRHRITRS